MALMVGALLMFFVYVKHQMIFGYVYLPGESGPNPMFVLGCSHSLFNLTPIRHMSEQFVLCN